MSFFEAINDAIASVNSVVNTYAWYLAFVFLIGLGLYFTIRTKGVQLNRLGEACRVAFTGIKEKKGKQTISSFQAFCTSTKYTIYTRNRLHQVVSRHRLIDILRR